MASMMWLCTRCGNPVSQFKECERCFPSPKPRAALKGEPQGLLGSPVTMVVEPSPTIDVLDLDRSALRALEEIAKCSNL